jgi:hypothetical protein
MYGWRQPMPRWNRCSACGGIPIAYCTRCELVLCPKHKLCPDCDADDAVVPLDVERGPSLCHNDTKTPLSRVIPA